MRKPLSPNSLGGAFPTTTAGNSVILFDSNESGNGRPAPAPSYSHVSVRFLLDQAVTFIVKWAPEVDAADSALAIVNGAGSPLTGEAVAANTFFDCPVRLGPGRVQISVLMGTPAPTANFIAVEANTFDGAIASP